LTRISSWDVAVESIEYPERFSLVSAAQQATTSDWRGAAFAQGSSLAWPRSRLSGTR
jgi:hypothetical protein